MTDRKTRGTGRPTLEEVARRAGVSTITASRALRDVKTVGLDLVQRVRDAAKELGYATNTAARALASARSEAVVVLVPSLSNLVFVDVLESIHTILRPQGFEILIGNTHYACDAEEELIRRYVASAPSGMILTGSERTEAARRLIDTSGVPYVHMMEILHDPGVHCVGFVQTGAGEIAAEHLIERGRRRNAFVAAQLDPRIMQRGEGFRRALQRAGMYDAKLEFLSPAPSSIGLGCEMFAQIMERHADIDGIFFGNDDLAHGALLEALRRGVPVPQQVAMVGFNDLPGSAYTVPRLTTIRTPRAEIGRRAALMLLAMIRGERVVEPIVDTGFELIVRESS
ncbi:LacI family DNA-binding transcriptional regulator [Burkholderia cepacia]|uniref:LacI family DNA-binding transcriptional regulator n=1 Tax=Burkholderia cepacia TaxID=292 RepID=UPI00075F493D|nr:LacI family DNA-binding transcriptional regulator [Burkholderia cepacia]KVH37505.1 LacI family transcriptional regulator [Burkholderia cepacia]